MDLVISRQRMDDVVPRFHLLENSDSCIQNSEFRSQKV